MARSEALALVDSRRLHLSLLVVGRFSIGIVLCQGYRGGRAIAVRSLRPGRGTTPSPLAVCHDRGALVPRGDRHTDWRARPAVSSSSSADRPLWRRQPRPQTKNAYAHAFVPQLNERGTSSSGGVTWASRTPGENRGNSRADVGAGVVQRRKCRQIPRRMPSLCIGQVGWQEEGAVRALLSHANVKSSASRKPRRHVLRGCDAARESPRRSRGRSSARR